MSYKCVILDFDGTIADTHTGIVNTFRETFRTMGLPELSEDEISLLIGLTLRDGFRRILPNADESTIDEAIDIYHDAFERVAVPGISLFPGVVDVLEAFKSMGLKLAIATSRGHDSLAFLTEKLGIAGFFDAMYATEDVVHHKPAPDLVNLVLADFHIAPSEALVVGDASYDLLMGQGAGCRVCGVTWGNQTREQLSAVSPDFIIDSISDILDIVKA